MTEQLGLERSAETPSATYILPLKRGRAGGLGDLPGYLQRVLSWAAVLTGIRHARTETLVIADDDVRYTADSFRRVADLLQSADVVRPQNNFSDLPWHARWDTARSLLNRALGADYPGTLGCGVRRCWPRTATTATSCSRIWS
ncbi:glycosyltransferase [Arthrobacter caoxuetaonis]|uniref:glycosyltransferase n=1 Tax=Arthrobacter caoxuetaonis TaxID=2886935 RepID=UPI001D13786D|nr:glycosyltransferase [Arthrobacter caoxuetaonis]MCC3281835.1 glycosyltransferase [Arthrobacter caoxuetaonis]